MQWYCGVRVRFDQPFVRTICFSYSRARYVEQESAARSEERLDRIVHSCAMHWLQRTRVHTESVLPQGICVCVFLCCVLRHVSLFCRRDAPVHPLGQVRKYTRYADSTVDTNDLTLVLRIQEMQCSRRHHQTTPRTRAEQQRAPTTTWPRAHVPRTSN